MKNIFEIRYSIVIIFKDLLDLPKKNMLERKDHLYILLLLDRQSIMYIACCTVIILRSMVEED